MCLIALYDFGLKIFHFVLAYTRLAIDWQQLMYNPFFVREHSQNLTKILLTDDLLMAYNV